MPSFTVRVEHETGDGPDWSEFVVDVAEDADPAGPLAVLRNNAGRAIRENAALIFDAPDGITVIPARHVIQMYVFRREVPNA